MHFAKWKEVGLINALKMYAARRHATPKIYCVCIWEINKDNVVTAQLIIIIASPFSDGSVLLSFVFGAVLLRSIYTYYGAAF